MFLEYARLLSTIPIKKKIHNSAFFGSTFSFPVSKKTSKPKAFPKVKIFISMPYNTANPIYASVNAGS